MQKLKSRISIISAVCLTITSAVVLSSSVYPIVGAESVDGVADNVEIIREIENGVETVRINNLSSLKSSRYLKTSSQNTLEHVIGEYDGIDLDLAKDSNYIVSQTQTLDASGSWTDGEKYMTIYTTAYHRGYTPSGNARYQVVGEIVFHKTFKMRNEDQIILNHSSAGVFDSTGVESGVMSYHYYYHNHSAYVNPPIDYEIDEEKNISPSYTQSYGVCYKIKWPKDEVHVNNAGGAIKQDLVQKYTNWRVKCSYYVIATNDTNIAVNYIHNENIFGGNLGVSFGAYGVSVNITIDGSYDSYYARPILVYNI